jgi:hypothetical protein
MMDHLLSTKLTYFAVATEYEYTEDALVRDRGVALKGRDKNIFTLLQRTVFCLLIIVFAL